MWKFTNKPRTCAFRVLLALLIIAFAVSGCEILWNTNSKYRNPRGISDGLLDALTSHLRSYNAEADIITYSTEEELDFIRKGKKALFVSFDPDNYYYVCGYFNAEHNECRDYCCCAEYLWISFSEAEDIKETYRGEALVVAFQINKTKTSQDICSPGKRCPVNEYYQIYTPIFENGNNIADPIHCEEAFLYVDKWERKERSWSERSAYATLPCVKVENEFYYAEELSIDYSDGGSYERGLQISFGKYYDALCQVMITGKYTTYDTSGNRIYYGLFRLEDIASVIADWEE